MKMQVQQLSEILQKNGIESISQALTPVPTLDHNGLLPLWETKGLQEVLTIEQQTLLGLFSIWKTFSSAPSLTEELHLA